MHTHKYSSGLVDRFQNKFVIENGCFVQTSRVYRYWKIIVFTQAYCYTIIKYNDGEKNYMIILKLILDEIYKNENEEIYKITI